MRRWPSGWSRSSRFNSVLHPSSWFPNRLANATHVAPRRLLDQANLGACTHKIASDENDRIDIRFGSLCGL